MQRRYGEWLAVQQQAGRTFTPEQRWWLDRIAEHIGVNLEVAPEDLDYGEFFRPASWPMRRAHWARANPGKRYVEPQGVDAEGFAALPEGWVWATRWSS